MVSNEEYVFGMLEPFVKAGCTVAETTASLNALADILKIAEDAGINSVEFVKQGASKEGFTTQVASGMPWGAVRDVFGSIGNTLLHTSGNLASRLIDGAINNAGPALVLGPLAAGAAGYGAGQLIARAGDDPDARLEAIKHQELMSALRRNAQRLKPREREHLYRGQKSQPMGNEEEKSEDENNAADSKSTQEAQ